MKTNNFDELICSKEEFDILSKILSNCGVNLCFSMTDCKTFNCYVRNPYQEVVNLWGNDLEKKLSKEFFERYNK